MSKIPRDARTDVAHAEGAGPNVYDDAERAAAYATLGFPGTYALAFRDLPGLLADHIVGRRALDFGCGTGRSTRFLRRLGFTAIGVDIAAPMVARARDLDPEGDYRVIADGDLGDLADRRFDLILAAFTFDNIAGPPHRAMLLRKLAALLDGKGRIVLLGSTPEIYWHEWASFSTAAFPDNEHARGGDAVHIVMKDVRDARPIVDTIWYPADYETLFHAASLRVVSTMRPLGRPNDGVAWVSETRIAPWVIYVLAPGLSGEE